MSPILELTDGRALLRVAPHLGGRATACVLEDGRGGTAPLLHPCPELPPGSDLTFWPKGGLYPLVPYSGRIAHARLRHEGATVELAPHPEAAPHTLHGTAHRQPWSVVERQSTRLRLACEHRPDAHWPWPYRAELDYTLQRQRLGVALRLTNTGPTPMPAGIGLHPFLAGGADARLQFDAAARWRPTPDSLCAGPAPLETQHEFHRLAALPTEAFTMFYGGWDGRMTIERGPGARLRLRASPELSHLIVFRPAGPGYLCIEPVSHAVDAFTLQAAGVAGTGARTLAPGASLAGRCDFIQGDIENEAAPARP